MYEVYFPRSKNLFCSVLMATRDRPDWLCQSISSVFDLAVHKNQLEFLLKVDDDDTRTIDVIHNLKSKFPQIPVKMFSSPRGRGYADMDIWLSALASHAQGDWLFVFNDDAVMRTQNWDNVLMTSKIIDSWHQIGSMFMLVVQTLGRPDCSEFFFLRREVFQLLGHMSKNTHVDTYLYTIMDFLKSIRNVPIEVEHYSDRIGDKIREESEATYATSSAELNDGPCIRDKLHDINTLMGHINSIEDRTVETEKGNLWRTVLKEI